jgi:hypothetical protein
MSSNWTSQKDPQREDYLPGWGSEDNQGLSTPCFALSGEKFEPISTNPYLSIINRLFNEINWLFLEFLLEIELFCRANNTPEKLARSGVSSSPIQQ